jgi:predicted RNA-binding Zn ribbon-like protein
MFDTDKFLLVGNNLSLDFVNTMIADAGKPKDLIEGLADVMSWAIAVRLIEKRDAARHFAVWNKKDGDFLSEAVRFRAILRSLFTGILNDEVVKGATLKALNEMLDDQTGFTELVRNETGFEKRFHSDFREPRQVLASVAASAADLLCYGNLDLIKRCEGEGCVLYFYDTTKNHSRRWCSMAGCGNRAKASAFYRRKKLSTA